MLPKRVKEKFIFLIDDYGMEYIELGLPREGLAAGPMVAFCFYNQYGVFVIGYYFCANELNFYKANVLSTNPDILLQEVINDKVFELEKKTKGIYWGSLRKIAYGIKKELKKSPVLFGIPLFPKVQ